MQIIICMFHNAVIKKTIKQDEYYFYYTGFLHFTLQIGGDKFNFNNKYIKLLNFKFLLCNKEILWIKRVNVSVS